MCNEYDFSNASKNPDETTLNNEFSIDIDITTFDYFNEQAKSLGIACETLISLYLRYCAENKMRPPLSL